MEKPAATRSGFFSGKRKVERERGFVRQIVFFGFFQKGIDITIRLYYYTIVLSE